MSAIRGRPENWVMFFWMMNEFYSHLTKGNQTLWLSAEPIHWTHTHRDQTRDSRVERLTYRNCHHLAICGEVSKYIWLLFVCFTGAHDNQPLIGFWLRGLKAQYYCMVQFFSYSLIILNLDQDILFPNGYKGTFQGLRLVDIGDRKWPKMSLLSQYHK